MNPLIRILKDSSKLVIPSLEDIYNLYSSNNYLVLDFETSSKEYGDPTNKDNRLLLACWYDSTSNKFYYEVVDNEYELSVLPRAISKVDFIVAHNAKFELQWLKRVGLNLRELNIYDTFLAQWVLDGNRKLDRSLGSLSKRYNLNDSKSEYVNTLISLGVDAENIPRKYLLDYCLKDVELTKNIFEKQISVVKSSNLLGICFQRFETCKVLADIEFEGMTLDKEKVKEEYSKTLRDIDSVLETLHSEFGTINYGSSKQLSELIYNTLGFDIPKDYSGNPILSPKGSLSVSASKVIPFLKAKNKKQSRFLELYTKYSKLRSLLVKNLRFFQLCCEHLDGKFLGKIHQGVTSTHRLASSGKPYLFPGLKKALRVQFQNLPREYKPLFKASREGWEIMEFDAAQLEFRVAAELCKDDVAIDDIINGVDVHSVTAKVLSESLGKTITRQEAKAHTFAPLYGSRGKTQAEKDYVSFFRSKYSKIAKTQDEWAMKVANSKFLKTPLGMVYYWPNARVTESGSINVRTEVFNYPIQGSATAEIVPIGLICFWYRTEGLPCRILNSVHDSVVVEFDPSKCREHLRRLAVKSMTLDVFRFLRRVYRYEWGRTPLGVSIKVSSHWAGTKKEESFDVFNTKPVKVTIKQKE